MTTLHPRRLARLRCALLALMSALPAAVPTSAQSTTYDDGQNQSDALDTAGDITLTVGAGETATQSGLVAGSGSLTKTGAGALALTGVNTYSGGTTVSAGTLSVTTDANLGDMAGGLAVTSGAHLHSGGYFGTNRAITLDGSGTSLHNNGELIIGYGGTGSLTLTNGATVSAFNLDLAYNGGTGTVNISSGSAISAYNVIYYSPTSTVNLNDGGTLTTGGLSGAGIFNLAGGTLRSGGAYSSSLGATLSNASTIDTNGHATTLSGILSGSGSLTKTGAGTLTLSGANTYSGGTTVGGGTLAATDHTAFGTGAISVASGGAVALSAPAAFTRSLTVVGDGSRFNGVDNDSPELELLDPAVATRFTAQDQDIAVAIRDGGAFTGTAISFGAFAGQTADIQLTTGGTLTASRGFGLGGEGDVTLSVDGAGSKLAVGNITAPTQENVLIIGFNTGDAVSTLSVGNGGAVEADTILIGFNLFGPETTRGVLDINDGGTVTAGAVLLRSNTGHGQELTINSGGTLTIIGGQDALVANQSGNVVGLNGGTLRLATHAFSTGAGAVLGSGTTSTIHTDGVDATLSGVVSGDGGLTKTGSGTLTLSGANTYTGGTTVSAGTLTLGSATTLQHSTVNLSGGSLGFGELGTATLGGLAGSTDLALTNTAETPAPVALAVGANGASTTYSGVLSGSGSLTKSSAGTLTLTGANNYSGGTTVSAGTLTGNTTSLQGNIANNAALVFEQIDDAAYSGTLTGTGNLTKTGAGNLTLSNGSSATGTITVTDGALAIGSGSTASLAASSITNNASLAFNSSSDLAISTLSGTGGFTKTGSGTLTITNLNSTGGFTVSAGELVNSSRIDNQDVTISGNTAKYTTNAFVTTIGYNGTGSLTIGDGGTYTLTDAYNLLALAYYDTNSSATVTVTGTGSTLTSVGWLGIGKGNFTVEDGGTATFGLPYHSSVGEWGDSNVTIGSGGTLTVSSLALGSYLGATATLNINAGGTLVLGQYSGLSLWAGNAAANVNLAGGTIRSNGTTSLNITTNATLADGTTSTLDTNGQDAVISGTFSGAGSLTKTGAGTLQFTAAPAYTGATTITGGTLRLPESSSFPSATIMIGAGASLHVDADSGLRLASGQTLGGAGQVTGGTLTLGSGATLAPGNSPGLLTFTGDLVLEAGSFTTMEIGGTTRGAGYDAIDVGGHLSVGGTLTVSFFGGYTPSGSDTTTFDLFDFSSIGGSFAQVNLPTVAGYTWNTANLLADGTVSLVASAIPEPSAFAAFASACALGLAFTRRRHRT